MSHSHPAATFIHAFHDDLSAWFSGEGDREAVWRRLEAGVRALDGLVYPSGNRLTGSQFCASIADRFGSSPGFRAEISDIEIVHDGSDHVVVAYCEGQVAARSSASRNGRSALALLMRAGDGWTWRFIQETALPG